jgi:cell division protein ZapA
LSLKIEHDPEKLEPVFGQDHAPRSNCEDFVSQVNVTINGRQFRMACEDGQEGHLQQLARDLDERIVALRGQFGEIGDARLTVMAALMVADELAETGKKLKRLEADHAALKDARGAAADRAQATEAAIVAAFNSAAERIEGLAKKLGQSGTAPGGGVAQG